MKIMSLLISIIAVNANASEFTASTVNISLQNPQLLISASQATVQLSTILSTAHCNKSDKKDKDQLFCDVVGSLNSVAKSKYYTSEWPKIRDGLVEYNATGEPNIFFEDYLKRFYTANQDASEIEVVDKMNEVFSILSEAAEVAK